MQKNNKKVVPLHPQKTNTSMLKKILTIMLVLLTGAVAAWSRPATKGVIRMTQPDGSTLGIRLQGDEYRHWNTTDDGYSIVKNAEGYYVYARLENGQLAPTDLVAHDADNRSADELSYITNTGRLVPMISPSMRQMMEQDHASQAQARAIHKAKHYDYEKFKGLVILVEYNDCQFTYENYRDIMESMINQDDYQGDEYTNFQNPWSNQTTTCTGSMRDYFRDNSNGIFVPTFDVVGPVQIDHSQYFSASMSDPQVSGQIVQNMIDACTAADSLVDFSDYDTDNDGKVDMIYFIYAGLPSYIQGNDERLLWPHQSDISYSKTVRKDGVKLGRYACSTELYGYQSTGWSVLEGIGTICHEFSHVLGLPDFYDTDYDDNGQSVHPASWSVMAGGEDYDFGRRPCGYSLFERYALGFAQPQVLSAPGSYTLEPLVEGNSGYRIDTPQKKEYFLLENRQQIKWDEKLPGPGMLVFRVDSTNISAWTYNTLNVNPNHNYYELVRAKGYKGSDSPYDPFPGIGNVTQLDNETSPANLLSWGKKYSPIGLENIQEDNGVISFDAFDANVLRFISMQENISLGVGTSLQLNVERKPLNAPYTFVWTSDDENVATVSEEGLVTGVGEGQAHVTLTANDSLTAVCTVTVNKYPIVTDIATMRQQEENTEALLKLTNAQVLYVNGTDIYLRDATGSIILSSMGLSVTRNDLLNGAIYGCFTLRDKMPVLAAVEDMTDPAGVSIKAGSEAKPVPLHISQLSEENYADMVTVQKAKIVNDGGMFAVLGDRRIRLYNLFKVKNVKVPSDLSKRYDVTAVFGTDVVNDEIIDELYLLKSPVQVAYTELEAISLPETAQVNLGRTRKMGTDLTLTPANADVFLCWSSSNENVATVSQEGVVKALADGMTVITVTNLENGLTATCRLTVGDKMVIQSIAGFKDLQEGTEAELLLTNAQVLFVGNQDAYVRDATGAIRFAATGLPLNNNDVLNGQVYGLYSQTMGIPQLLPIEGLTIADDYTVTAGAEAQPREVEVASITEADLADLVVLRNVSMNTVDGLTGVYVTDGSKYIRIYNDFQLKNITLPKNYEGYSYDLTGILLKAEVAGLEVFNLALTQSPDEVGVPIHDGLKAILRSDDKQTVVVYTSDGRMVAQTTIGQLSQLSLKRGVYVLKTAGRIVKMVKP